jgi:thiol-disulfide isomerase/thioredoxin
MPNLILRCFLSYLLAIWFNYSFSQSVSGSKDSTQEYLSQMQAFLQENESLNISDFARRQNLYKELKSFITKHSTNEIVFSFFPSAINLTYLEVDTLLKLVDSSIYQSPQKAWADVILKRISVAETGKAFPALILTDTSGIELSISSLKNKIVFIDVWSSWCGPCREQIPSIKKLYKKYKNKGFEIIGISMDEKKQKWLTAIQEDKQTWRAFCELKNWRANKFAIRFSVLAIPANFLIDQNGILVGQDLSAEDLSFWLKQNS